MDDARLQAIKARSDAATVGPWRWQTPEDCGLTPHLDDMMTCQPGRVFVLDLNQETSGENKWVIVPHTLFLDGFDEDEVGSATSDLPGFVGAATDVEFIAHAREDVPDLIAALEASRAECARLRVALVAEWACNHQERCDNTTIFHDDKPAGPYGCLCPLPDVVTVEQARAALNGAADATVGSEP